MILHVAGWSLVDQCPELTLLPQRHRPDTQPEHQDLVSHMAEKKREKKKKGREKKIINKIK